MYLNQVGIFARSKNEREARREAEDSDNCPSKQVVVPEEEEVGEPAVTGVDAFLRLFPEVNLPTYRVILKADVGGSLEALREILGTDYQ